MQQENTCDKSTKLISLSFSQFFLRGNQRQSVIDGCANLPGNTARYPKVYIVIELSVIKSKQNTRAKLRRGKYVNVILINI